MQHITISGRLGRDAVIKESTSGERFLTTTVAVNSISRGAEKTTWYEIISFNPKHMGKLKDYLKKGSSLIVMGELDVTPQLGTDGKPYARTSILVDRIDFANSSSVSGATVNTVTEQVSAPAKETAPAPTDDIEMVSTPKVKKTVKAEPVTEEVVETQDDGELPF